jgi:hypothetical protein
MLCITNANYQCHFIINYLNFIKYFIKLALFFHFEKNTHKQTMVFVNHY